MTNEILVEQERFVRPPGGPYALTHSLGCLPKVSAEALRTQYLDAWAREGGDAWPGWLEQIAAYRHALSRLLGGEARQWCPQVNASAGLAKLLAALAADRAPERRDRRILLVSEDAFPSLGFALQRAAAMGFETRLLPGRAALDAAPWDAALDARTALALVTHVHSNTGEVSPVADIAGLCRQRGALCVVDVAQSAGILPFSLGESGADVVLGSCIKWLCGGPGAGFIGLRPEWIARLEPPDVGWFSHARPFEFDIRRFEYADDALRFWGGTPDVAPFVLARASLEMLAGIGIARIFGHNRVLMNMLLDGLPRPWQTRLRPRLRTIGGTLCAPLGDELGRITAALRGAGVRFDTRGEVLRLSLHLCNDAEDARRIARAWSAA